MAKKSAATPDDDNPYDRKRESMAEKSREQSAAGREIGAIPPIADVERRGKCRGSLRQFCETYNPKAFALGWSVDHLKAIARIEEAATLGALYAFAMARGSGKTTLCRMAALWAVSYAIRRYTFVIGATEGKAADTLDTLRVLIRFLDDYAADFPEIAYPAQRLAGIANRASGQTCNGKSTLIEWSSDQIVLPTVPPPENWPAEWPLRADGMVPTSGVVVSASGLTGDGIRGSLKTLMTGEQVRPDFVLLDDPQTPESARSLTQNDNRLNLVSADVLGMAGPGKAMAAVMPCTVIERGDMIDEVLDRSKHPLWRGERSGMLRSLPKHLAKWDDYFAVYSRCAQLEPPDFTESNAHYLAHRAVLDEGCEAAWESRKEAGEVSAIQSAMHLYFRDRRAFMSEYMNRPEAMEAAASLALTAAEVEAKVSNLPRYIAPRDTTRCVAMIDVGGELLWWTAVAWNERFGGAVVDYGVYPEQRRDYFSGNDPRLGMSQLPANVGRGEEARIYAGLSEVTGLILGRGYQHEELAQELRIERCLIDANWGPMTDVVYEFCRRSPHAAVLMPSHGKFIGASSNPMGSWQPRPHERPGWNWRISAPTSGRGRHVTFDTNHWKTFAAERIRTPDGGAGCLRLFAGERGQHALFADHLSAEYPVSVARVGGRTVEEWKALPNRDNHWLDCLVGCCVAASIQGVKWSAASAAGAPVNDAQPVAAKPKKSLAEKLREKRGGLDADGRPVLSWK